MIVLGCGNISMGMLACFARLSLIKLSSAPESTRKKTGRESLAQSSVPRMVRQEEVGQVEIPLVSTPACTGELNLLAEWGKRQ